MILTGADRAQSTVLRDGTAVDVRPVGPDDEADLLAFLNGLSVTSRYHRFFSLSPDLERAARGPADPTGQRCFGLLALTPGAAPVVGHTGYWLEESWRAEMAIAVADDYRGRGLGSLLLRRLVQVARERGIEMFVMDVLLVNGGVVRLLSRSGHPLRTRLDRGVLRCELWIGKDRSPSGCA